MDWKEATLLFGATFAGVLLAFALDGWRQHVGRDRWLRAYVGGLVQRIEQNLGEQRELFAMFADRTHAFDSWLAAREESDLSDAEWQLLGSPPLMLALDLSPVLRSDVLTDLPVELVDVLQKLDDRWQVVGLASMETMTVHRMFVASLVYDREIPLSARHRAVVLDARANAETLDAITHSLLESLDAFTATAKRHGYTGNS